MKTKQRLLSYLLALTLVCSLGVNTAFAAETKGDIVILYTNDVHCAVDGNIGYAGLSAYKSEMQKTYGADRVTLVDAGDFASGAPIGSLSDGMYIVEIMNQVGYDVVTLGNHDIGTSMDARVKAMKANIVSCNYMDLTTNQTIFEPYHIVDYGDTQVAYLGICTPESIAKGTPAYFKDSAGNYIQGFCSGDDGQELYRTVQKATDNARAAGADYVVAVAHLGVEETSAPFRSTDVIAHTAGIDAMLDGHSHTTIPSQSVKNAEGKEVVLTSSGTALKAIGKLTIASDGKVSSSLVTDYTQKDADTAAFIGAIQSQYEEKLNQVVARTEYDLVIADPTTGKRIIRSRETNLGDLLSDAYRIEMGAEIAFLNGGDIRAGIPAGEITFGEIYTTFPWSELGCVVEATGQEILDALEFTARNVPNELGGFLQVSGLTYEIHTDVASTIATDEEGMFVQVGGARRVQNVKVLSASTGGYEALDTGRTYTLASHAYMLKDCGDGINMFTDNRFLAEETKVDTDMLMGYLDHQLGGVVGKEYSQPYGQGRITVVSAAPVQPETPPQGTTYVVMAGDSLWRIAQKTLGSGSRWAEIYRENQSSVHNPSIIYIGQMLQIPAGK